MLRKEVIIAFNELPESLQQKAEAYIMNLFKRTQEPKEENERPAGLLKGKLKIASNFDDSIADFAEYQ